MPRPTAGELIAFEDEVAAAFEAGKIRAPTHLSGGNEAQLIEIFEEIRPNDWVFASYRQHHHALLHGVPRECVMAEILAGRSMSLTFPEHRFYSWGIVGGLCPIAVGVAAAIKRRGEDARVWCFVGDMAARMGIFDESRRYAANFELPIVFVVEDNGFACDTPTGAVWGEDRDSYSRFRASQFALRTYRYERNRAHVGIGKWVSF